MSRKCPVGFLLVLALVFHFFLPVQSMGAEPETFKIANIWPFTGAFGVYGEDMKRSIELAVADYGGKVLGKPIELIFLDSQSNPTAAVQQTVKGIAEGAQFITGAFSSSCTLAMMPVAAQRKIPHLSFLSTHDDITGAKKTRYTFRTSTAQSAENKMIAKYLKDVGAKSVYAVGADYGVIRVNVDLILKDLGSAGIKTYSSFSPMGTKDFSVIIEKIEKSDADTVLLMTLGRDEIALIKQLGQKGLNKHLRMASTLVVPGICDACYPYSLGIVNTARYDPDFANAINKKWSNEVYEKYGPSNLLSPDFYDGMLWFLTVIDKTGSWDKEKWIDAFENSQFMTPKGLKVMCASDHQARQEGFVGEFFDGKEKKNSYGIPYSKCGFKVTKTYLANELYPLCEK